MGLSQRHVAESLGLTALSVIHYEAGRTPFPTDLLPALEELGADSAWLATGVPSLENKKTRERFAAVLAWVRREAALNDLTLTVQQEVDVAWYAFRRLMSGLSNGQPPDENEIGRTVRSSLGELTEASK